MIPPIIKILIASGTLWAGLGYSVRRGGDIVRFIADVVPFA